MQNGLGAPKRPEAVLSSFPYSLTPSFPPSLLIESQSINHRHRIELFDVPIR